jgi:1,4-alpha-glucan branching enzyme
MRIKFLARMIITVLVPIHLWGCAPSLRQNWGKDRTVPVRFIFIDAKAARVCLSGSFNQWSYQSHCMQRDVSAWSITVPLPPGRYEYGFMVDGNDWQADPGAALSEESGFGKTNSVLIVE